MIYSMDNRPNEREAISNLQRYLRRIFESDPNIETIPIDGIFESATRNALTKFQIMNGLPATGIADIDTWELLYARFLEENERVAKPEKVMIFPPYPKDYAMSYGDNFFSILVLQHMLSELSANYDGTNGEYERINLGGVYDDETLSAVTDFQNRHGLDATGAVDKITWNRIVTEYNILFEDIQQ